jgi:sec-independent protein translocase protein TatA
LAIVGYEGIIVGIIVIVLFIYGPHKLPEMARSIGQAKREFEKATKEFSTVALTPAQTPETVAQEPVIVAAKSLGITTEGKTKEEIAKEIAEKTAK